MLWCSVYLYYLALLNKPRAQVLCISNLNIFLIIKAFNLFRLLENKTLIEIERQEIVRQEALERELDCVFIRINPDESDFNIFKEINKIHRHVKKSTKKSLIDNLSNR